MNLVRLNNRLYNTNRVLVDEIFNNFFRNDYHENFAGHASKEHAANVFETEDSFKIEVLLPGFKKEDVKLNYEKNLLTIKVDNKEKEENPEEFKYSHREFGAFNFEKQYRIPKSVNDEKISANFENGILNIVLLKKEETIEKAAKEIEIS